MLRVAELTSHEAELCPPWIACPSLDNYERDPSVVFKSFYIGLFGIAS